ncbi:MAG: ThuA domain-containing protein [Planctomycetota bacterium]|nr:ThuA domain-containing protein [Planctomycetota bacterium]
MMIRRIMMLTCVLSVMAASTMADDSERLKALIIDGQNNHGVWPQTTKMMKKYLEETGLFSVTVATTVKAGTDPMFKPDFSKVDVVISNYNGAAWPQETQASFIEFLRRGGGFVVVHAANNSFGNWKEYNTAIGLGGWGGRNEKSGPYVYINEKDELVRDTSVGRGGHHGSQHPFLVTTRNSSHPVTSGMPGQWLHEKDELYDLLRGPAENMTVLATAFSSKDQGGTGRHEPMIFTVAYGKGRVFHTPMGHGVYSQECVGFIVTLQRGAEWAATGKVTQKIPSDFPGMDEVSKRKSGS